MKGKCPCNEDDDEHFRNIFPGTSYLNFYSHVPVFIDQKRSGLGALFLSYSVLFTFYLIYVPIVFGLCDFTDTYSQFNSKTNVP